MEVRIRELDPDTWKRFRLLCLEQGVSANQKLLGLIEAEVEKEKKP